ncbi:MAG: MarR family transcriptional regulator [Anaerovoracaceae bacterium]
MNLQESLNSFYYSAALSDLRFMNQHIQDKNITYNSLLYLELIFSMNGKCTASQIADLLYISKPAVTLKINELIKQGFVIKTINPDDHRQNFLFVNEDMMPKYKFYRQQDSLAIEGIKNKYSKEEIEKFCEMLGIVTEVNFKDII